MAWLVALFAVLVLAYLPALRGGFIWDDADYVAQNQSLHDLRGLGRIWLDASATPQYYPLVFTSFWLEYHLWGLNPLGFHVINLLLHTFSALLLWRVLLVLEIPGAWLAAAIFALHPVEVESVAWITERKNVLSAVFFFAAVLAYFRFTRPHANNPGEKRHWNFHALALLFFVAALLSKTVTCSLPLALLLVHWWKTGRMSCKDVVPLLPFFVLGAGLGLHTAWLEKHHVRAQGADWSLNFLERCLIAGRAIWFYASKLALPVRLTFIYPRWQINLGQWWQWLFPIATGAVVVALWKLRTRFGRGPLTAVLFFIITLGPALGFVNVYPMRYSFVADHFQYLAGIGLIVLVAAALDRAPRPASIALLLVLAGLTWQQGRIYTDLETLWSDTLAKNPQAWIAHDNLGTLLLTQGKTNDAISLFQTSAALNPHDYTAPYNLGIAMAGEGRLEEAVQYYRQASQLDTNQIAVYFNLGNALSRQGKSAEAIQAYEDGLRIHSTNSAVLNNLGGLFLNEKRYDDAIRCFKAAIQATPDFVDAYDNLANALLRTGNFAGAITNCQAALRLNPSDFQAWSRMGYAQSQQNLPKDAEESQLNALRIQPGSPEALYGLAMALALQGRNEEALKNYRKSLRMNPGLISNAEDFGRQRLAEKQYAEAIACYTAVVELKPGQLSAQYDLGNAYAGLEQWANAAQCFRAVVKLNPNLPQPHYALGYALAQLGDRDNAVVELTEALKLKPDFAQAMDELNQIRAQTGTQRAKP